MLPDDNIAPTYTYIFGAWGGHRSIINRQLRATKRCWIVNTVHVLAYTEWRRQRKSICRTAMLRDENWNRNLKKKKPEPWTVNSNVRFCSVSTVQTNLGKRSPRFIYAVDTKFHLFSSVCTRMKINTILYTIRHAFVVSISPMGIICF